ncbi:MAG: 3-deoxy-manno-octulosonate cytidylyltransferase [Planctomycetes bacterium]|nr:3-deoxy-manno-octulosonate cytidylyltransferase [Planctomycetota bacterium]
MRCAIVIPARYGSSRLPGKPLLKTTGKYLIQHVYEQACQSKRATDVVIATDDSRIMAAVQSFGGRAVMTRRDHVSGTDRVAEVARGLNVDVIVNLQGDEPLIDARTLDLLPDLLEQDPGAKLATLAVPLREVEAYRNPNVVKVVRDRQGRALYFSRSPIPMVRDGDPDLVHNSQLFLHHLGLYAYRRDALLELASLPPDPLEQTEKLEQLRVLGMGWPIQVGIIRHAGRGVDTRDDYDRFVSHYREQRVAQAA